MAHAKDKKDQDLELGAMDLPEYDSQTTKLLPTSTAVNGDASSIETSALRSAGLVRVEIIQYRASAYVLPRKFGSFLVDRAETHEDLMHSIREQLELQSSVDVSLNDLVGIRMHNKGPGISPRSWSKLNKKLERVEVVLERNAAGQQVDR